MYVYPAGPHNFDTLVNGKKFALVEFYAPCEQPPPLCGGTSRGPAAAPQRSGAVASPAAPAAPPAAGCGHCKSLTPEYAKLGAAVLADPKLKNRVVIGKVNADDYRDLGTRFGVGGYPTLKWFSRGKPVASPEECAGRRGGRGLPCALCPAAPGENNVPAPLTRPRALPPRSYNGGRNVAGFLGFIRSQLDADKGFARVDALTPLARAFNAAVADAGKQAELADEAEAAVAGLAGAERARGRPALAGD